MTREVVPFGKEWFAEVMRMKKSEIAEMFRESAIKNVKLEDEINRLGKVVCAIRNSDGVRRCISNGCDTCRYKGNGCNSLDVVKAVKEYENGEV